jgi:aryl-alcohol dehydrogenase-like predicted oxidoreductase
MSATPSRKLGHSGIEISAMGIGCWAIGGSGWGGGADDEESIRGIHRALELGITFFDTADVYGLGRSERVLGAALTGRRQQAVIATKFGYGWDEATMIETGLHTDSAYIRSACEASLKRLNTDYIDLYQFHANDDFGPEGAEELRDTLESLVAAGKIRAYGWSTDFPDRARVFAQGANCAAIQVELNVLDDAPDILEVCDEYDLAAINRGPLAMGLLTGKYKPSSTLPSDDVRGPNAPEWMKYFKDGQPNPEWLNQVNAVGEILRSGGRTLAQGAIAWLWGRSGHNIPIPGYRNVAQVEENCGALAFGALTEAQVREIDEVLGRQVVR